MCKRTIKPVVRPNYVDGQEAVDAWFMNEYGITEDELNAFDEDHRVAVTVERCEIKHNNSTYYICADEGLKQNKYMEVCDWLQVCSLEELKAIWQNPDYREDIKGMIRYPGGMHEWLMVALVPVYKEMGIDMHLLKQCRTETSKCVYLDDNEKILWKHGGNNSTTMHNKLKKIYISCLKKYGSADTCREMLAYELERFKSENCKKGDVEGLDILIGKLRE